MPNILNGTSSADIFTLGENGICFGSSDPERDQYWYGEEGDDSVITSFDPQKDSVRLAGTREDYLLRDRDGFCRRHPIKPATMYGLIKLDSSLILRSIHLSITMEADQMGITITTRQEGY